MFDQKTLEENLALAERYQALVTRLGLDKIFDRFGNLSVYVSLIDKNLTDEDMDLVHVYLRKHEKYKKIDHISLKYNRLTKMPDFSDLPSLKSLYLCGNRISEIGDLRYPNLEVLSLGENQLTDLPPLNLPCLKSLYLGKNRLTKISSLNFPELEVFELHHNRLTSMLDLQLPELVTLNLDNNRLTKLPSSDELNFPKLRELSVRQNRLTQIKSPFGSLCLRSIDLTGNCLTEIPKEFDQITCYADDQEPEEIIFEDKGMFDGLIEVYMSEVSPYIDRYHEFEKAIKTIPKKDVKVSFLIDGTSLFQ